MRTLLSSDEDEYEMFEMILSEVTKLITTK